MTVHWLDEDEVTRQSACLGVHQIFGSHTDVLAREISDMHAVSRFPKEFSDQEISDDKEHIRTCHTLNLIATTNVGQISYRRFSQI